MELTHRADYLETFMTGSYKQAQRHITARPALPSLHFERMQDERDSLRVEMLGIARSTPRLAAYLVASGTLEVIIRGLPNEVFADRASPSQAFLVSAALGVLDEVYQAGANESSAADLAQAVQNLQAAFVEQGAAAASWARGNSQAERQHAALLHVLSVAAQMAAALQAHWQRADAEPERQQAAQLELAQAAATRASCAHLACPNVGATGQRGKLCTGCRVARYCCRSCSVADWRAGHRVACSQLAAARAEEAAAKAAAAE